ncbi:hypothetical protein [Achromobacter sp.]|uniref:hypothetical protein n=1 Tax=Achromobacter sp. TaxID=134375 RepID=UPI003C740E21
MRAIAKHGCAQLERQSAKNHEKAQMHNALPYGSNRLCLFRMLAKHLPSQIRDEVWMTRKAVENFVDKIAQRLGRLPAAGTTILAFKTGLELRQSAPVKMPHKIVEADCPQSYPPASVCGLPLRKYRGRSGTDSLTRQLSCTDAKGFTIILLGEDLSFM